MAEVRIFKIDILQTHGSYVSGDVLELYLEVDDAKIPAYPLEFAGQGGLVYLNGVLDSDTTKGFNPSPPYSSIQGFNPLICVGETLITGFATWFVYPFFYYYTLDDHFSCQVNPSTCDLIVSGIPTVTPATTSSSTDGAIILIGQSSNPIQYKIGSDFAYDDGTAQNDGDFQGLLTGSYRVFLRDSNNCAVNILVNVPVNNTYGVQYRAEYYDAIGLHTRIDIVRRGYDGAIIEVCGSDSPFELSLRGEGSVDKFEPIQSIQGIAGLLSETDMQFLDIYTNDPNLYRKHYYKDLGNTQTEFIPSSLDTLDLWIEEDPGAGLEWTDTSSPSVSINGTDISEIKYTDYDFEVNETYTLEYNVQASVTGSITITKSIFRILILDSSGNSLSVYHDVSFKNGSSLITDPVIGEFSFVAPPQAARICFFVDQDASSNIVTYTVNSIINVTPSRAGGPVGLERICVLKVLPNQFQEEYKAPPYYSSIKSTCGLPELKDFYLIQEDGQKYYGTVSLIKLISFCLSKIGTDLPIRVACNLFADNMDDENNFDDPFEQAYIDFECFYIAEKEPTLDFVLRSILDAFGCTIKQWHSRWNIVRVEESVSEYSYRDFDKDGNYIGNGTFNPVKSIKFPSQSSIELIAVESGHNLEIRPGYGKIHATYELGLKSNIINNGDFRLKSIPWTNGTYLFKINTDGFSIVSAGYILNIGEEVINNENVALSLSAGAQDAISSGNGGEAYVLSEEFELKMGTNNQVKLNFRYKIVPPAGAQFGDRIYRINVPYTKVRIVVTYGSLYLQNNGIWTSEYNEITFFENVYNEYLERDIVAVQPITGTPVTGMPFKVKVFHAFGLYYEYNDPSELENIPTIDSGNKILPDGFLTESFYNSPSPWGSIYFYRLEENTSAPDGVSIVRPDDYHATTNPRQWIRYATTLVIDAIIGADGFIFCIDRIRGTYLTDGQEPIDTIIRQINAEQNNKDVLEKNFIIGSYTSLQVTEVDLSIPIGISFTGASAGLTTITRNVLSAELIYTGWLRDSSGLGFENWHRSNISESDKLHGIAMRVLSGQYRRSWRLLRGAYKMDQFFGVINVAIETNDNNRIYQPISLVLNDKRSIFNAEFHELKNVIDGSGSDGTSESPFSSAFSNDFGQQAFN